MALVQQRQSESGSNDNQSSYTVKEGGRQYGKTTESDFEQAKKIISEFDSGRTQELTIEETACLKRVIARVEKFNEVYRVNVEISPYMKALGIR